MNDSRILGQLIALLRAGLSFHQAERAAKVADLSTGAAASYQYLRGIVLQSGGQPTQAIERVRQVIEENQAQLRRVELANASPRATVRLVLWLPIAALVIGQFTGMGSLEVLLKAPLALASVLIGGVLLAIGSYWSARMLRSARVVPADDAIYLDGIAMALSAGLPIEKSIEIALKNAEKRNELELELQEIVNLSKSTGAALSKLVLEKADSIRGEVYYQKSLALEKLSVRLMIPLGASVLPAFALIAVVPLAMSFLVDQNGV
ncbi:MAG: type II secretion system F family protein [Micrococcales bacterium]